ncbi:MAG: hypothetical protein GX945_13830 [Lentisphaerae bacterium]|nr:hypothetical protein [Lentisphaerota bacterium]
MRFARYGKSHQMVIENGQDLSEVLQLDEALWGATSAPAQVFYCDQQLIAALDQGAKGRITCEDVKDAITWLLKQLPDKSKITAEFDGKLPLADINTSDDSGKALITSAEYILKELNSSDTSTISLEQIRNFLNTVQTRPLNGDGVLTEKSVGDNAAIKAFLADIVAATGGAKDFDGSMGVSEKELNDFLAAIPPFLEWLAQSAIPEGSDSTAIMTRGAETPALNALLQTHSAKIDRFFELSRMMAFDKLLQNRSVAPDVKVAPIDPTKQDEVNAYLSALPIAHPNAEALLPLYVAKINPLYQGWWQDFLNKIVKPVLGDQLATLNLADWQKIKGLFAPYNAYLAAKKGGIVEKIPADKLRAYLKNEALIADVRQLLAQDKAVADTIRAAKDVEKLLLYRSFLIRFANNFVCFRELYAEDGRALFECGSLVIDGRWFNVALKIDTIANHQLLAKSSQMFTLYVEVEKSATDKMIVVVPVTSGSKGNLVVGKRGVFYDINNKDYDAKILQVVENPVCIREAMYAPFSRLWGLIEGKIEGLAGTAEKNLQSSFNKALTPGATPPPAPAAPPPPVKGDGKMPGGTMLIGASVAFAALGSAFAFISKTVSGMTALQIWISVLCAALALVLPVILIAVIKLSRQDLSSILEGCGWAINLRMRLDAKLRNQFTNFGIFPKDAEGTPRSFWLRNTLIVILVILLCVGGCRCRRHRKELAAERAKAAQIEAEAKAKADAAEQAKIEAEAKVAAEAKAAEAPAAPAAPAPAPAPAAPAAPAAAPAAGK